MTRASLVAALALGATACLSDTAPQDELPPMCEITADCDHAAGEVCDEGVCWGDPPEQVAFGAVLLPPEGRIDLVPTEIPSLSITRDGTIEDLAFADTVTLSGRVVLAVDRGSSVAAQIKVRRPSALPGGPDYTRSVLAAESANTGELGFSVALPRLQPGDAPYEITVVPDDGTLAEAYPNGIPADVAPPARLLFAGTEDEREVEWVLGDESQLKLVTGRVVNATGIEGEPDLRVVALGRWSENGPLERASSIATTDEEGFFSIWIPLGMGETYDIWARPAVNAKAPSLRLRNVAIPDPTEDVPIVIDDLYMPAYPTTVPYVLPVKGPDSAGGNTGVAGAEVKVWTVLIGTPDGKPLDGLTAVYTTSGVTDPDGNVELQLIPGGPTERMYFATVAPLPDSPHAAVWAEPVAVGAPGAGSTGNVLVPLILDFRVALRGTVVSAAGDSVANATIATTAAPRFRRELDTELLAELDTYRFPTGATDEHGQFLLWLDPRMLGAEAVYDLDITPPMGSGAPRWSVVGVAVADHADAQAGELPTIELPAASYARGLVTGGGAAVAGAQLKVYEIAGTEPCEDGTCQVPARLRSVTASREDGEVIAVLPDP